MNNISKISASEEKNHMIETAAYFRAQKRGFSNGDPVKDWLEAEREIDALFQQPDDARFSMLERAACQRMRAAVEKMEPRWDAFTEKSHGFFEIWKDKGCHFLDQAHTALNSWVGRYRVKNGKEKNENGIKF